MKTKINNFNEKRNKKLSNQITNMRKNDEKKSRNGKQKRYFVLLKGGNRNLYFGCFDLKFYKITIIHFIFIF